MRRARRQIELFFDWIKKNLRIEFFYRTSENAVKTQIWIAVCAYLMVAIFNKTTGLNENLSRILQVVSGNIFSKDPIHQLFMKDYTESAETKDPNQLMFNDF